MKTVVGKTAHFALVFSILMIIIKLRKIVDVSTFIYIIIPSLVIIIIIAGAAIRFVDKDCDKENRNKINDSRR